MRAWIVAVVVAGAGFVGVPASTAGPVVSAAAAALQRNPVYVHPAAAKSITPAQAAQLREEIRTHAGGPIYIAILPQAALDEEGGDPLGVLDALYAALHRRAVYGVVAGGEFRAASVDLGSGVAAELATQAYDAHHTAGIAATLLDFIDRVGARRAGGGDGGSGGGGGFSLGGLGILPLLLILGVAFFAYRSFRRRRLAARDVQQVKETVREDLIALAEDVQQLEEPAERDPAAKRDYLAALDQYARASGSFDRARTPEQLAPVAEALEEGRYLMASAQARLEGRRPPERRVPCFFDPRHGPSVRDVVWSPPGYGSAREVPACAACALRVEEGEEPDARQVPARGQLVPYWAAGPMYGSYFGGFFPGFLLGEMLGFGTFGWGMPVVGGYGDDGFGDGGFDDGDGGDLGGGDFGVGGGDFGGGDFGGGGGGDF